MDRHISIEVKPAREDASSAFVITSLTRSGNYRRTLDRSSLVGSETWDPYEIR